MRRPARPRDVQDSRGQEGATTTGHYRETRSSRGGAHPGQGVAAAAAAAPRGPAAAGEARRQKRQPLVMPSSSEPLGRAAQTKVARARKARRDVETLAAAPRRRTSGGGLAGRPSVAHPPRCRGLRSRAAGERRYGGGGERESRPARTREMRKAERRLKPDAVKQPCHCLPQS